MTFACSVSWRVTAALLKLPANPQADAADALAIAITHCHVSQNAMQMSESRLNLARGRLR